MMKKYIKKLLLFSVMVTAFQFSHGQQFSEIIGDITKIKQAMSDSSGISFTMRYLYSKESKPSQFLDSLGGVYKIKGRCIYSKMLGSEVVQNDSVCITVYDVDKTIVAGSAIREKPNDLFINNWDSAFVAYNVDTAFITVKGNIKTMKFRFTKNSSLHSCTIAYDKNTYLPERFSYITTMSKIPETGKPERDGMVITVLFRGYNKAALKRDFFSTDKYITVQNGKAVLKPAYQAYKLFQSTSRIGK